MIEGQSLEASGKIEENAHPSFWPQKTVSEKGLSLGFIADLCHEL